MYLCARFGGCRRGDFDVSFLAEIKQAFDWSYLLQVVLACSTPDRMCCGRIWPPNVHPHFQHTPIRTLAVIHRQ